MLFVKYYEWDHTGLLYRIKCGKFYACYPVENDSMIFETDGDAVVIEIRKILSIEFIEIESYEKE